MDGFLGKRVKGHFGIGWTTQMTYDSDIDAYNNGYNDAIKDAIKVITDFDPYDPYIVGKMKIEERKKELILSIKDLKK